LFTACSCVFKVITLVPLLKNQFFAWFWNPVFKLERNKKCTFSLTLVKAMKRRVFEEIWMTFLEKIREREEEEAEATNTVNGKYLDRFFHINWVWQKNGGKYFISHILSQLSCQIFYTQKQLWIFWSSRIHLKLAIG